MTIKPKSTQQGLSVEMVRLTLNCIPTVARLEKQIDTMLFKRHENSFLPKLTQFFKQILNENTHYFKARKVAEKKTILRDIYIEEYILKKIPLMESYSAAVATLKGLMAAPNLAEKILRDSHIGCIFRMHSGVLDFALDGALKNTSDQPSGPIGPTPNSLQMPLLVTDP